MFFGIFLGFLILLTAEGVLVWLVARRLSDHFKENPEAVAALTTHLFVPLLGKKEKPEPEAPPSQPPQPFEADPNP